jgi:hypothetical protein
MLESGYFGKAVSEFEDRMPVVGASPVWLSQGIRSLSNTNSEDKDESGMLGSMAGVLRG